MVKKTSKLVAVIYFGILLFSSSVLPVVTMAQEVGNPLSDFTSVNYDDVNSLQGALENKDFPFVSEAAISSSEYNSTLKQQEGYKKTRSYFMERIIALGGEAEVSAENQPLLKAVKTSSDYGYFKDIQPIAPDIWVALFNRPSDGIQYTENFMRAHKVNGQHAFCIDPGEPILGTPNYTSSNLTSIVGEDQANKISAIQTVVNETWNDTSAIAGQEMIWSIRGATNIETEPMRQAAVDQAKNTIQSGVDELLTPVKFDKTSQAINAGDTAIFSVQSGGKDLYVANVSEGASAKLDGSKIVVTTENNAPDEVTVTLGKGNKEANHFVWTAGSNQRLSTAEYNQGDAAQVKLKLTKKGKIIVHKKDESNKPLAGAEFTQYDKSGKTVAVKTTDKSGDVEFEISSNNTYEVKETKNPVGYSGTFDQKNITLANNGQVFEYTAKNTQDKGKIIIHKKDETDKALKDAEFAQYDQSGKVVAVKKSDANGDVSFDILSNNTYEVKETKNPTGYHGTFEQKNITLANNGQVFEYTAKNIQDKGKILIHKKDENGKAVVGAEFTETDKAGKTVAVKKTDKEGNVVFDIQSNETYAVKETKVPEGYEGSFEKKNITLKDDGQTFEYTAINNHKHEVLIQTDSDNYQSKGLIGLAISGFASAIGCIGFMVRKFRKL